MGEQKDHTGTNPPCQYQKISPAPNWVSIFTKNYDLDAPGYAEAFLEAHNTSNHYGWAIMTTKGIAVIKVTNWDEAKKTMPYQWLNTHKKQPAPVSETLELAKETAKVHYKKSRQEVL
jgi:hypothetical protein